MAIEMYYNLEKAVADDAAYIWLKLGDSISDFPTDILKLKRLKRICLEGGSFETIPKEIATLKRLTHFKIIKSQLKSIPKEIGQLSKLLYLELFDNKLESIPEEICDLARLKFLYLQNNCLTTVPVRLHQLINLQGCNLSNNQIISPPPRIDELPALRMFYINDNPLEELPISIFFCKRRFDCRMSGLGGGTIKQDLFWNFVKRCQKLEVPLDKILDYHQILLQNEAFARKLSIQRLLEALNSNITNVAVYALEYLTTPFDATLINENSCITILAKTNLKKGDLKKRLTKIGIPSNDKYSKETTHVVIQEKTKGLEALADKKVLFIKESHLIEYLDTHDTPFILDESEGIDVDHISDLILTMDEDNIALALGLLETGGVPATLITELFAVNKLSDNPKIRKKAKQLLLTKASPELAKACTKKKKLEHDMIYVTVAHRVIDEYCKTTELDGPKLSYAMYKKNGVGIGYALSFGSSVFKSKILNELMTGNELHLGPKEWLQVFPNELLTLKQLKKLSLGARLAFRVSRSDGFARLHELDLLEELDIANTEYPYSEVPPFLAKMTQLKKIKIKAYDEIQEEMTATLPNCEFTFVKR